MYEDNFTEKEKQKMKECVASICTMCICGSTVIIAAHFMEVKHILMFSYGMGLLTRPLTERVTKLIERK